MEAAERAQTGGALFNALYNTMMMYVQNYTPANPSTYRKGPITIPFAPDLPKTDNSYLRDYQKIKEEVTPEVELWDETLREIDNNIKNEPAKFAEFRLEKAAKEKATNELFMKEMQVLSQQFKEGVGMMNQLAGVVMKSAQVAHEAANISGGPTVTAQVMPTVSQLTRYAGPKPLTNQNGQTMTLRELAFYV
ncbi:hypothetical protein BT96DRAFT_947135 [Gymnopus androsaceus JB14]|uniref:Uncharacterized protein n=1 Tax=Gymnopus androsaceus JB14 TaxID=1447944 RepID=A0A6A4GTN0_9AGAR|nr:hypothetical protein BT96DRAFT_947135 [Gymnopus androsaceus JB14]